MNQSANNPFGDLTDDGIEAARDTLGGGGVLESGVYDGVIKLAYAGTAKSGARSLTVCIDLNGREYRETVYVTSGTAKGCKNYYEKDGKKSPLPGFTVGNDLALLSTGQALNAQEVEECVVKLYDFDVKAEVPTKVNALVSMHGKPITIGVLKQLVDKNKLNESTKMYEPTGETREENLIDKVFHTETGKTVSEFTSNAAKSEFKEKWAAKNTGVVRDRTSGKTGKVGEPGRPAANSASNKAPVKSLFA